MVILQADGTFGRVNRTWAVPKFTLWHTLTELNRSGKLILEVRVQARTLAWEVLFSSLQIGMLVPPVPTLYSVILIVETVVTAIGLCP